VFHRVRVGPFRALDEVDRTRSLLTQNNIPARWSKKFPHHRRHLDVHPRFGFCSRRRFFADRFRRGPEAFEGTITRV